MHLEEDERQERKEVVTAHSGMTDVYRFLCGRREGGRRQRRKGGKGWEMEGKADGGRGRQRER